MLVQMAFRRTEILTDSGISFHVFALPCTQYFLVSLLSKLHICYSSYYLLNNQALSRGTLSVIKIKETCSKRCFCLHKEKSREKLHHSSQ